MKKNNAKKTTKTVTVFKKGQAYFIRTVTYHLIGEVVDIVDGFILLKRGVWVADSGRFMQAINNGALSEVEPVGDWFVSISSIVDGGEWKHPIPTEQK